VKKKTETKETVRLVRSEDGDVQAESEIAPDTRRSFTARWERCYSGRGCTRRT